ncbi:hypothetical protein ACOBQX_00435 [Actinokineospora sp. G85]|uniref:hypothetical protein n=1 Tax=Actinokineospora sp. G85 TaxID=3406626 RepID=UPI003C78AA98
MDVRGKHRDAATTGAGFAVVVVVWLAVLALRFAESKAGTGNAFPVLAGIPIGAVVVGLLAALTPAHGVRRFSLGVALGGLVLAVVLAVMMAIGIAHLPNRG